MLGLDIRKILVAATLATGVPLPLPAQTTAMKAEQGWSAVARCAQADSELARHNCLDRVLRDAGLLTSAMRATQQRRTFGLEDRLAPPARPPAASVPSPTASAAPAPAAQEPPDRLGIQIASVQKALDGKLLITTTEGAVWRQSESVEMPQPPAAGDHMMIRKGSLGGYRCSVATTNLTFRCERSR